LDGRRNGWTEKVEVNVKQVDFWTFCCDFDVQYSLLSSISAIDVKVICVIKLRQTCLCPFTVAIFVFVQPNIDDFASVDWSIFVLGEKRVCQVD